MPDALPPATRVQIDGFLSAILPAIQREYDETLALFNTAVELSPALRLLEEIDAHTERRLRQEVETSERIWFLSQMSTRNFEGSLWGNYFARWCLYVVRDFVSHSVQERVRGLMYTLPYGLTAQYEAMSPEERAAVIAIVSHPRLQITEAHDRTNALVLRQVD